MSYEEMNGMEDPMGMHAVTYGDCGSGENRYKDGDLFCWRGRVSKEPECIAASVCSPISYTEARTRFCLASGGSLNPRYPGNPSCVPNKYVSPLPGEDPTVYNRTGGIVTYHPAEECQGLQGHIKCLREGISTDISTLQPHELFFRVAFTVGGLFVIALIAQHFGIGQSIRKNLGMKPLITSKKGKPKKEKEPKPGFD